MGHCSKEAHAESSSVFGTGRFSFGFPHTPQSVPDPNKDILTLGLRVAWVPLAQEPGVCLFFTVTFKKSDAS